MVAESETNFDARHAIDAKEQVRNFKIRSRCRMDHYHFIQLERIGAIDRCREMRKLGHQQLAVLSIA